MKKTILFALLLITICSCEQRVKTVTQNGNVITINVAKSLLDYPFSTAGLIDTINYVPLETNNDCIFGTIDKLCIIRDTIYILDKKNTRAIYAFSINGKFLYKISKHGKGPGEYYEIENFYIRSENIILFDSKLGKLLTFNLSGKFISEKNIGFQGIDFALSEKDLIYFYLGGFSTKNDNSGKYLLSAIDTSFKLQYLAFPINDAKKKIGGSSNHAFYIDKYSEIYYNALFSNTVYKLSGQSITPIININFGEYTLKESDLNVIKNIDDLRKSGFVWNYNSFLFTDEYIYFDFILKSKQGSVLYSKKLKQVIRAGINYYSTSETDYLSSMPVAEYKNKMVSIVEPISIRDHIDQNPNEVKQWQITKQLSENVIKKIKETDNPILMFYTLKNEAL